jgi:NAD(P)-dependent dehydrogenase (short-subunit alcohol dehydrogenase family)
MLQVDVRSQSLLSGRKGLVVGIANEHSIAYGCARMFRNCGAELGMTWINEKTRGYVEPLARELGASIAMQLDVEQPGAMESVFDTIRERWGHLDFLLHSIGFAPAHDLQGRVADTSREGFTRAMDVSCHSFIRMARLAEPLMDKGGTLLTMTYLGADEVVPRYGVMGPVRLPSRHRCATWQPNSGRAASASMPFRPARSARARLPGSANSTSCSLKHAAALRWRARSRSTTSARCARSW